MTVTDIELYELLKSKMGEREAQSLVEYVKSSVKAEYEAKKDTLATKEDLANVKADLIKWMFAFWIGSIATLAGIMFVLLNAYLKQ